MSYSLTGPRVDTQVRGMTKEMLGLLVAAEAPHFLGRLESAMHELRREEGDYFATSRVLC